MADAIDRRRGFGAREAHAAASPIGPPTVEFPSIPAQ